MIRTLVIVESPSKCKKMEEYTGHPCVATCGHFREIADGLAGINDQFEPTFTLIKDKKAIMTNIRKMAKDCRVILATDDDREGEAIAWHVCKFLHLPIKTTLRIVFHEITRQAVEYAMHYPRTINTALVKAQHARQVLDLMIGYRISPFLWSNTSSTAAGRCQTPTLRLLYDNHLVDRTLTLQYQTVVTLVQSSNAILNHEFDSREQVEAFLQLTGSFSHVLTMLPKRFVSTPPPKPLTTSRLMQLASSVLRMSPSQTMKACQSLYQEGRITYMRTDSEVYAESFYATAADYIRVRYGPEFVGGNPGGPSAKAAHEAIRVTDLLDTQGPPIYQLIWQTTVESCMSAATKNVQPATISAPQGYQYALSMDVPLFAGWKCVKPTPPPPPVTELQTLSLYNHATIPWKHVRSEVAARNTHAHYTEATLVKRMEEVGIGRPSTYASLVKTIQDRGYASVMDVPGTTQTVSQFLLRRDDHDVVVKESLETFGGEKGKLVITPRGIECVDFLMLHFAPLFEYDYTHDMELKLDAMAAGRDDDNQVCRECLRDIDRLSAASTTFPLADSVDNVIVMQPRGNTLRRVDPGDNTVSNVPIVHHLDLDRAKDGKYTTSEILRAPPAAAVRLGLTENVLRPINSDCSVRQGKYGPYLYYQTSGMHKPVFFPAPPSWRTASEATLCAWVTRQWKKK